MKGFGGRAPRRRRARNVAIVTTAALAVGTVNAQVAGAAVDDLVTGYQQGRPDYTAQYGSWETVELPEEFRVRAVHAVLLRTGKVLIVAGSGNDPASFDAGTFETVLWDPAADTYEHVETPEDLFCGGHAQLPDGNVLIAGGTSRYEVLADDVTHAAGVMTVTNEDPTLTATLEEGTVFVGEDGQRYRATAQALVTPAVQHVMDGEPMHMASETTVWVEALEEGEDPVVRGGAQFAVEGLAGRQAQDVYGIADAITLDKQEYRGIPDSYVFDVTTERYERVGDLHHSRWYPTLVPVAGGDVMAVSGLDEHGRPSAGEVEVFDRATGQWRERPELFRYFPTYPALLRLADDRLFYTSSNAGYGPATEGRTPGYWDLTDNSFDPVPGLRDPHMNETSSSVLLPPAQEQQVLVAGGGEVGEGEGSTARVDVIDTDTHDAHWTPAPDLPAPARYVSTVVLPDDRVLLTGGSTGYRGNGHSDTHAPVLYDAGTNTMAAAAPNEVGRNYHSEALLLPDGRVVTLGSDPLYADAENTRPGTFETRVEIYTPPYLHTGGERPRVTEAPAEVDRGATFPVRATGAVTAARLMRPSAVTHVTDVEQRSVALDVSGACPGDGSACDLQLSLDPAEGLTPAGWYMLFLVDADGVPSVARWVHVR
ncbi:radical copper oxidase GlxA [Geodermatophilus sp. SYSU D01036]